MLSCDSVSHLQAGISRAPSKCSLGESLLFEGHLECAPWWPGPRTPCAEAALGGQVEAPSVLSVAPPGPCKSFGSWGGPQSACPNQAEGAGLFLFVSWLRVPRSLAVGWEREGLGRVALGSPGLWVPQASVSGASSPLGVTCHVGSPLVRSRQCG